MMVVISIDGVIVPPERAVISVLDRGLLYGDGLFEVLRTWHGVAVELDRHLDRLCASAQALELRVLPRELLRTAVIAAIAAAGAGDHRVRVIATRGEGGLGARFADLGPGRAIVIVEPLPLQPRAISAAIVDWPLPRRPGAGHKTLAYLDPIVARELAAAVGADEAIRLGADGTVVEGATCNVFVVHGGAIATPRLVDGALPGVTRARALECCAELGLDASQRSVAVSEVLAADEIFVTSSLRGIVGVTRLDGQALAIGPVTTRIAERYVQVMDALAAPGLL
jgi:branched-chain amino acid aminotransferase